MCVQFGKLLAKLPKRNMSTKQGMHKWSSKRRINMVPKCISLMDITAELKAYRLSCLFVGLHCID